MRPTTVLFDLDGTLLPMDQDVFIKDYFAHLAGFAAKKGYDPSLFSKAVMKGTGAMLKNNGNTTNEEVFWKAACDVYGENIIKDKAVFDEFYEKEFVKTSASCSFAPQAAKIVRWLKQNGIKTALATNPIFPLAATAQRIRWAGLDVSDFEYVSTYENSRCCKPSSEYYYSVLNHLGVDASECIMVGNDVSDDMPARNIGMQVFLLTPCLINTGNIDISCYPNGGFEALCEFLAEQLEIEKI